MSRARKLAAGLSALVLSTVMVGTASAAGESWDGSQRHYNVYSTYGGVESGQYFMPPSRVDRFDMATHVFVTISPYRNASTEEVRVCYTQPYASKIIACTPYRKITVKNADDYIGQFRVVGENAKEISGGAYSNISAKGNFTVHHRFPEGLSSPLIDDGGSDSIVVCY